MSRGYVYILINEAMPGLVKIGMTTRSPQDRALELFRGTTGLPAPFDVYCSVFSPDCARLEADVHYALADYRLSSDREFFSIDAEKALACLEAEHSDQVGEWVSDFAPNKELVDSWATVCPEHLERIALMLDEHVYNISAAISMLTADEIAPGLERWKRKLEEHKAKH